MDKIVELAREYPYSDGDIRALTENKVNIVPYPQLAQYNDIDDVLGVHGAAILLYETKQSYGHWVALFRVPDRQDTLEVFDSYGMDIDSELLLIPDHYREVSNQNRPHLSYLIQNSHYKNVIHNNVRLQRFAKDQNTCGRWCGLRVALKDIPLQRFQQLFLHQRQTPDWLVTIMTMFARTA
jgi:hypothetical protein